MEIDIGTILQIFQCWMLAWMVTQLAAIVEQLRLSTEQRHEQAEYFNVSHSGRDR